MTGLPSRPSFSTNGAGDHRPAAPRGPQEGVEAGAVPALDHAGVAAVPGGPEARGRGVTPPPPYRLPTAHADREPERRLREQLRAEVGGLLGARQLLSPGEEERNTIRALIEDRVGAYQRNAANTNTPQLADPKGVERRLYDHLLGLGLSLIHISEPTRPY